MFGLLSDVIKIAVAPVQVAADLTRVVTKPLADAAEEVVKEVKETSKDLTGDK